MKACIIIHNMIIEDEGDVDAEECFNDDHFNWTAQIHSGFPNVQYVLKTTHNVHISAIELNEILLLMTSKLSTTQFKEINCRHKYIKQGQLPKRVEVASSVPFYPRRR
jgi:hypothetical protein